MTQSAAKANRWFDVASFVSAGLLAATVLLAVLSLVLGAKLHHLSLSRDCHVGLFAGFAGNTMPRVVVFNDLEYGPYRGSIIGLSDDPEHDPKLPKISWFGDTWGIYYRHFFWPTGAVLWTLSLSLWYPFVLFAVLPGIWLAVRVKSKPTVPRGF